MKQKKKGTDKLSRRVMLKEIKTIKKFTQRKHVNNNTGRIKNIMKSVFFVVVTFGITFAVGFAPLVLDIIVVGKENWAIAIIALPLALFGIFIPQIMQVSNKYSARFKSVTLKSIYKKGRHFFDFFNLFIYWLCLNFAWWIGAFLFFDYTKMVIYSILMLVDMIYLICFLLWKNGLHPCDIYLNNVMNSYLYEMSNQDKENSLYDETKKLIDEGKTESTLKIVEEKYTDFFEELDNLMLAITSNRNNSEEKNAYVGIIRKVKKLKFKETNALILIAIYCKATKLFNIMLEQKDYLFCKVLISELIDSLLTFALKYQDFIRKLLSYMEQLIKSYDSLTIKEYQEAYEEATKFIVVLGNFLDILTLFNKQFITTIESAEKIELLKDSITEDFIKDINGIIPDLKRNYLRLNNIIKNSRQIHLKEESK